jgi:penicillin amidase
VYAKNYRDIFFGLGYAHAEDRMWSLYFKKMFMRGRTAEIFGPLLAPVDL